MEQQTEEDESNTTIEDSSSSNQLTLTSLIPVRSRDLTEFTEDNLNPDGQSSSSDEDQSADETFETSTNNKGRHIYKEGKRGPYQRRNVKKIYRCDQCGLKLLKRIDYKNHLKDHRASKKPTISCEYCPEKFFLVKDYRIHAKSHKVQPVKIFCPQCEYYCYSEIVLEKHIKTLHLTHVFLGNSIKETLEVEIKKKPKKAEVPLRSIFECKICLLCFDMKSEVYAHEKFHLPEKVQWKVTCKKLDPEKSAFAFKF